jgi:hypothetical protein
MAGCVTYRPLMCHETPGVLRFMLFATCFVSSIGVRPLVGQDANSIRTTVTAFYDAMENHDTVAMRRLTVPGAMITSTGTNAAGKAKVTPRSMNEFIRAVGTVPQTWVQRLGQGTPSIHGGMGQFSSDYEFWINGTLSFCGRTSIVLAKVSGAWAIATITETQTKPPCRPI